MNCAQTMLGVDVISKDALQNLVSKEGYLDTIQNGLDSTFRFDITIDESRHTCILDVDHTLLFVRYFGDEMAVGDIVHYNGGPAHVRSMLYEIQVHEKLSDDVDDFKIASYRAQIQADVPVKGSIFTYIVENEDGDTEEGTNVKQSVVLGAEAVGCEVECQSDGCMVRISFEEDSPELFSLKPDMYREGSTPVALLHDGFLVRLRPRIAEFLNELNKHFNVILFTAAEKDVYQGLLQRVHSKLVASIGADNMNGNNLWCNVFYRDSCDVRRFGSNTYHVKDLCKFGIDMGRVFIVDNNPGSFRGFEPNAICCGDYFGATEARDDVLFDEVMPLIQKIVDTQTTDVRYVICNVPDEAWEVREDSRCEEEIAGCSIEVESSNETSNELYGFAGGYGLQTSVQSRRHSFHAGATQELSREIQVDRTIQFLQCLRRTLAASARIEQNLDYFQNTIMETTAGTVTSNGFGSLRSLGHSLSVQEIFVDSDSDNESVRTTVIKDEDIIMGEAGASPSPRNDEVMQLLGDDVGQSPDSSISIESNDEVLAMITGSSAEQQNNGDCCGFTCFPFRRRPSTDRML